MTTAEPNAYGSAPTYYYRDTGPNRNFDEFDNAAFQINDPASSINAKLIQALTSSKNPLNLPGASGRPRGQFNDEAEAAAQAIPTVAPRRLTTAGGPEVYDTSI